MGLIPSFKLNLRPDDLLKAPGNIVEFLSGSFGDVVDRSLEAALAQDIKFTFDPRNPLPFLPLNDFNPSPVNVSQTATRSSGLLNGNLSMFNPIMEFLQKPVGLLVVGFVGILAILFLTRR